ncbi:hypothetical protein N665_5072s0001 [Sinapis alba]|nr:hypothetical protein N665_5072s0001 [Sinapis alba]
MKEDLVLLFVGKLVAPRKHLRAMTIMQKKLGTEIKKESQRKLCLNYILFGYMGLDFDVLRNNDDYSSNVGAFLRDRESEK